MQDDSWLSVEPSDGGMPSSHAMSLGFIGTFTCLCLPQLLWPVLAYVAVSLVYRVHSKLHTSQQVIVGLLAGTCNGYAWWRLCHGTLIPNLNVLNLVSKQFLVNGVLPWPYLTVPATLGLAVVGSFERRISRWLEKAKES
jgi:membrane-associated phospholipid phosphatase